ncbi:hypothetical protein Q8A73_001500 [Channa argus]|nr:hypothetical protein Q8A73_001500 [Channa argus]
MLFQTVVLLLLCVSTGPCANLGNYQRQSNEEEGTAADPAAVSEVLVAASSVDAAKKDVAAADAQVGESPAADKPAANAQSADKLPAQMLMDSAAEKPEGDDLITNGGAAEDRETESDRATTEALAEVAVTREETSFEEEWNEIGSVKTSQSLDRPLAHKDDRSWSLNSIRNCLKTMLGYFDSLVELFGGFDGVCEYRCKNEEPPEPRPGYQLPEPNGCSSSLMGFQTDLGIPAMTKCCNELDICYDTCGTSKPYMNSQRAACVCKGEERDEL